jgi:hypothetical protein
MPLLLTSCGWKSSQNERDELINISALYLPPSVTMIKGESYKFKEGIFTPNKDQKFYSQWSYSRAVVIGEGK